MKKPLYTIHWLGAIGLSLAVTTACGAETSSSPSAQQDAEVHAAEVAKSAAGDMAAGEKGYKTHCQACHQADGSGLPGAFPPLADNGNIMGNAEYVIENVLAGRQGELTVNGVTYNGVMPAMSYLSDQDVADIVTYVLNSWGNDGATITADQVAAQRTGLGQEDRAGIGQLHRPFAALEQVEAERLLQQLDLPADRRLAHVQPRSRTAEMQLFCDHDEGS